MQGGLTSTALGSDRSARNSLDRIVPDGLTWLFGALAALLWAWACAGAAAQVPCSVANEVAPGQVRRFHFQRAGSAQDLLCVFTFQTQLGAPLAVVLHFLRFDNMTERDCECGELNMYDVLPSGEPVLSVSSSVALLTLSTHACPAPAFALSVGTPSALDVAPGDQHDSTTTEATTATRPPSSAPTRAPTRRPATSTTTTARPTRRSRPLHTTSTTTSTTTTTTTTTTEKSGHWWSG
ncbi:Protein of unknown function [Gryllus bimaculatus]|nr:Protein of unknown function [Gryllus bimaculatus]